MLLETGLFMNMTLFQTMVHKKMKGSNNKIKLVAKKKTSVSVPRFILLQHTCRRFTACKVPNCF